MKKHFTGTNTLAYFERHSTGTNTLAYFEIHFTGTNTLAYFEAMPMTEKSFKTLTPMVSTIKPPIRVDHIFCAIGFYN